MKQSVLTCPRKRKALKNSFEKKKRVEGPGLDEY